ERERGRTRSTARTDGAASPTPRRSARAGAVAPRPGPPSAAVGVVVRGGPQSAGGLIGREQELRTARKLLGASRLVTLVGAGGVGKTRLALAAAAALGGVFADGVAAVDLAPLA